MALRENINRKAVDKTYAKKRRIKELKSMLKNAIVVSARESHLSFSTYVKGRQIRCAEILSESVYHIWDLYLL